MLGRDITQKVQIQEKHIVALEHAGSVAATMVGVLLRAYGSNDPSLHAPCAVLCHVAAGCSNDTIALLTSLMLVLAAVGSDTVLTFDAANMLTLKNVALDNLHQDDFRFVA
ncbi:hypothetical protein ACHMW7_03015 [Aminobacter sp. UC22_36]|uniref:hypothetical protein n=1 Tax=Aminobacter sp. UC22_36 TaxID=3374549 RepID=UPI0037570754